MRDAGAIAGGATRGLPPWAGPAGMRTSAPLWDVTFLRRPGPGRAPRVAGRMGIDAPTAAQAREAASAGMSRLSAGAAGWSIGLLRPLVPGLPGTHLYRVTFSAWVEEEVEYRREDVLVTDVWATNGDSARRLARRDAEALPAYRGAWRIRRVDRVETGARAEAGGRALAA